MPAPRTPFRAAIIGTGAIAHAHAEALAELNGVVELVAVADVDPVRAAEFAERFGVARTYATSAELFAGDQLDIVHVCTPPQTHASLAIEAMRSGATALVEKPTALSLREMDELDVVQRETGQRVLTVLQHRFGPAAVRLRRLVAAGALGRPFVATCETLWYRNDEYFAVPWRGRWNIEGGGPTMGHGIHQFDLLLSILGPWAEVTAMAARQARPTDTEDVSMALARFDSGALATVVNSVISPRESSRLRFDFEFATVELEHLYGYDESHWTFTPAPGHQHLAELWQIEGAGAPSGHLGQFEAIFAAMASGDQPGVSLTDARRTMEFAAATYASAFRRMPVRAGELAGDDPFAQSMDGGAVPWAPVKPATAEPVLTEPVSA